MEEGEFGAGSMEPKIQAAIDFIGNSAIRKTIIAKLGDGKLELSGEGGTVIHK